jgi:ATP-dependent DNA helicase RecG
MNPAHLFAPAITIDLLKKPHVSRPGNKLIARIFHLMGLFESWGGGTLKIVTDIRHTGKPEPQFDFANGMFRVILPR